jgi:autotransporter-associated beta strand protein
MLFGIDISSTLSAGIFNYVLSGIDTSYLSGYDSWYNFGSAYQWKLIPHTGSSLDWDLLISSNITSGGTFQSSNLGTTTSPVFDGGILQISASGSIAQNFTITSNNGTIDQNGTTATFTGIFSDAVTGTPGSLFIINSSSGGAITLAGANTYSGGTTVASGTLSVLGASPTGFGNVSVSAGATLMGTGTINGQLSVAGILKPGHSPGYLAATNTVTMSAGSTYTQDIAGTLQASSTSPVGASGYYSFLNVTNGQFVIQPGSTLAPQLSNLFTSGQAGFGSAIYVPSLGDRLRIVTADGGISGKFSTVTQPAELAAGTQFVPFYNMAGSNSVDLAVIPTSYQTTIAAASGNANAQSVGGALTQIAQASIAGTATAAQDQLLSAISGQTSAQSIANLAQGMSGEVYAATVAVMAQTTQRTQQAVLNRLGDTAGLGLNMPMASTNMSTQVGGAPSASVSSNPSVNPNADAQSFSKGNVWGELAYQRGNRASDSQSGGWSSNLYQLTFGSDLYSSNGTIAGAGLALSSTTLNPAYGSSTIQQGSLFAYGKMPVESFVLDAMASVGLSSSDLKRGDVTGLSAGFRNNSVSGNDVMLSLGVSRPMNLESVRITPFARVTWQMVSQSGVNEGDVASALSVNRYTGNGVRGVIGLAAGSKASNPMTAKNTYRAYVGVGADSSGLLNPTLNASLAGINTNITTPNAGTAFVQAGLYGTAKMSENTFAYAGISGEARSGQTLGTVNVGLKLQF